VSKKNSVLKDIVIGDYKATWNLDKDGQAWIIQPDSVSEVGCIHTSQGLEVDYVGVIIGPDLIIRDRKVVSVPEERASTDKSIHGWKKMVKEVGEEVVRKKLDLIIKNTYRTLMTRGQKGCYVYAVDPALREYLKDNLSKPSKRVIENKDSEKILSPYIEDFVELPLYNSVGCGELMYADPVSQEQYQVPKSLIKLGAKYFVLRTAGDSMNELGINDGDYILCQKNYQAPSGSNAVVLVGDDATLKQIKYEKDGLLLIPKSTNKSHKTRKLTEEDEEFKVLGVFVCKLED
jgi:DUF2075 family protein